MSQSMLAIKTKLGSSSNSLRAYSAARGLTAPDSMLEFDDWLGTPVDPPGPTYYSFAAVRSTISAQDACDALGPIITVYSTCQTLITNCTLLTYFDAEPEVLRTVLSGWYSIGDNWYYVNNNSGTINSTGICGVSGCECYTIVNESGDRSIIVQYNRCSDGQLINISVPSGATRTVCVQNGGDVIDESGLVTITACGTPCNTNDDCTAC